MTINLTVSKFGGTSMASKMAMMKSAEICFSKDPCIVVVSATAGTTDLLIEMFKLVQSNPEIETLTLTNQFKIKHDDIISEIILDQDSEKKINELYFDLENLFQSLKINRNFNDETFDQVLGFGERISAVIFKNILQSFIPDKEVKLLSAYNVIKTNSTFGEAAPDLDEIKRQIQSYLPLHPDVIYVMEGFIGSDSEGNPTTLGRGGSDYTAALIGEAIDATTIEIWTDIPGIASTDPRLCGQARIIPLLSYTEAREMALAGAKILHPHTIYPAIRQSIPIFIGSTFEPEKPGTWVRKDVKGESFICGIAQKVIHKNDVRLSEISIVGLDIGENTNLVDEISLFLKETIAEDQNLIRKKHSLSLTIEQERVSLLINGLHQKLIDCQFIDRFL